MPIIWLMTTSESEMEARITARDLLVDIQDYFHDWIDGVDPVEETKRASDDEVWVKFESGAQFLVKISEVYE